VHRVGWNDDWWTRKDFERSGSGLVEVLFRNLPGGTEDNHENDQANILAEIRNEQLTNTAMIHEWWIGKDLKGSGRGLDEALSSHLNEVSEENHENTIKIAGIPVDIRTERVTPLSSLERQ
jgi:hypothetical protein